MKKYHTRFLSTRAGMVVTGLLIGTAAVLLSYWGNPRNMGLCTACFVRDVTGSLGLHRATAVQYMRPEIPGLAWGALLAALLFGEWRPRTGSSPIIRFVLGFFAMIGALTFLGCPWRAILRLAGGDGNALVGLAGLTVGVGAGVLFLKSGYDLGRNRRSRPAVGWAFPAMLALLLGISLWDLMPLFASEHGPGSMHAPVWASLGVALAVGFLAQRTRFCTTGAIRDLILMRDTHLLLGVGAMLLAAFATNLLLGLFHAGFVRQPVAHSNYVWNFLGMVLSGLAAALAGGCPGRQLALSGEGDADAAMFVLGMCAGAALAHNFNFAAMPDKMVDGTLQRGGVGPYGVAAVLTGLTVCVILGFTMREKES